MDDQNPDPTVDDSLWHERWNELYREIGQAVASWSRLEHAMAKAFAVVLGIPERRARPVFFSTRSFSSKRDLLLAAIMSSDAPMT